MQNFAQALYTQCDTYMKHGGVLRHLCLVRNGVLQGCPLAALLFVVGMDPFVQHFHAAVDSLSVGVTCLCADDIATVLRSLAQLVDVYKLFMLAWRAAGLTLRPTKCFLVPLSNAISPHSISCMRDFLRANTPEWCILTSPTRPSIWEFGWGLVLVRSTGPRQTSNTIFVSTPSRTPMWHLHWPFRPIILNAYRNLRI